MFNSIKRKFGKKSNETEGIVGGGFCVPMFFCEGMFSSTKYEVLIRSKNCPTIHREEIEADDYWEAMRLALYDLNPGETIVMIKEVIDKK